MEIELIQTCSWCPEQYDAMLDGKIVGYLRLRSGLFTVECPDVDGKEVYCHEFSDYRNDFGNDKVRDYFLTLAKGAIEKELEG